MSIQYTLIRQLRTLLAAASPDDALVADVSVPDGTTDNTAYLADLLSTAIAEGRTLRIPRGNAPWVISELALPSGADVDATGAAFVHKSGSNKRTLVNASLMLGSPGSVRDANIKWVGGTFTRGLTQNDASLNDMVFMFGFVDGFTLRDVTINQSGTGGTAGTGGSYGCYLYNVTKFDVANYTAVSASLSPNQSTLQLYGGCSSGRINGVYGSFGDDGVALVPRDLTTHEIAGHVGIGDIHNITIENVFCTTASNGVKLLGGSTAGVAPFYSTRQIRVRNIDGSFGSAGRGNSTGVWIGGDTGYSSLTNGFVLDCEVANVNQQRASAPAVSVLNSGEVHGLTLRAINNQQDSSAIILGTIGHCSVRVVDCSFTTAITTGSYYPITVTATSCRTLALDNVRLNAATSGSAVVALVLGTNGPGWLVAQNVRCTGKAYLLGDFRSTTRICADGVEIEDANGLGWFVTNTGAVIQVRGFSGLSAGVDDFVKTAGTVESMTPTFRCDIAKLTKVAGDMARNTNASTGAVGPWVSDGTNWKHLFSAATI